MPDKVELKVDGAAISHFISYQIDADLYRPADAFQLELSDPETPVTCGKRCEVYINDTLELTGIVDETDRKVEKKGSSLIVRGRDLMGLLVDSFVESKDWVCIENIKLKALAERLLATVPFINRKEILYQKNVTGKLKGKKASASGFLSALDAEQKINHIEPGMTVFEVLKNFSLSRGMLFYLLPEEGALVFGRPMAKGAPEYNLTMLRSGKNNNIIESNVTENISRRYSKVTVVGQQQGAETLMGAEAINTTASITDPDFPFYKPCVAVDNNDSVSAAMRALLIMEKHRREGTHIDYLVGRHQQDGKNWTINTMCHIKDEKQGLDGDYLIYGRTFRMDKQNGPRTQVRLGPPGLIA